MVNYKKELVSELVKIGLPVYAEQFFTIDTGVPCITYFLFFYATVANGDTKGYSRLFFNVKVWSKQISEIEEYSDRVDKLMRKLNFTRTSTNDEWFDNIGVKALNYRALAIELFKEE